MLAGFLFGQHRVAGYDGKVLGKGLHVLTLTMIIDMKDGHLDGDGPLLADCRRGQDDAPVCSLVSLTVVQSRDPVRASVCFQTTSPALAAELVRGSDIGSDSSTAPECVHMITLLPRVD